MLVMLVCWWRTQTLQGSPKNLSLKRLVCSTQQQLYLKNLCDANNSSQDVLTLRIIVRLRSSRCPQIRLLLPVYDLWTGQKVLWTKANGVQHHPNVLMSITQWISRMWAFKLALPVISSNLLHKRIRKSYCETWLTISLRPDIIWSSDISRLSE